MGSRNVDMKLIMKLVMDMLTLHHCRHLKICHCYAAASLIPLLVRKLRSLNISSWQILHFCYKKLIVDFELIFRLWRQHTR
jgi:hypothetical protein